MSDDPLPPDDDQQWLDLLAGRPVPDAAPRTAQEATAFRSALLACRAQAPAGSPSAPEQRVERLIHRARAAGLVPPPAAAAPAGRRPASWLASWLARLRRWPVGAAVMAMLVAGLVLVPWLQQAGDEPSAPVLRGDAVQTRVAADPAADREAVRAALRAAGLDAAPYQRLDRLGLDVELPQPLSARQHQALTALGLAPPAGPALRIEFVATETPR